MAASATEDFRRKARKVVFIMPVSGLEDVASEKLWRLNLRVKIEAFRVVTYFDSKRLFIREIPFDKLRAGSRPAGENAGLRDDANRITALKFQNVPLPLSLQSNAREFTIFPSFWPVGGEGKQAARQRRM